MNIPIDWLMEGDAFIQYRTQLDLLGLPEADFQVKNSRQAMLAHPGIQALVSELQGWNGAVISSHKSASQPFHKLTFLADLGLRQDDLGLEGVVAHILGYQSVEGPFLLRTNIPTHYGGSGADTWAWALCDAPLSVYALQLFGLLDHPAVENALSYLVGLVQDNGWHCEVSKALGSFRGPGRKQDPCPYATMAMLKALSVNDQLRDAPACHVGAETLLDLWQNSLTQHPYIFYMGNDFRKLKVPLVWYDLMHVLDVLSRFPWLRDDSRLLEMVAILQEKADPQGRFTVESVWTAWKDWEFGQKKQPSRWLTLLAWRILRRLAMNS